MAIVEEVADETIFWLELLEKLDSDNNIILAALKDEANQSTAIIVTLRKTAKKNRLK